MASSFGTMLSGRGLVKDTRACTIRRVAPTKSAPALKMVFTDCSRPNSRNAMITDSKVRMVRVRLRNRLAMTKPLLVMASAASGRLLQQLALLQMQGAPRELGGLGIVGDDHDRLAVLAVQHLQQAEDLFRGLAIQVPGGLIAHQQVRVGHQRAGDRDTLFLTTGQLPGLVLGAIGKADDLQRHRDILLRCAAESLVRSRGSSTLPSALGTGLRV